MSVRPFILNICRIGLAGLVCVLSAGASRAADEGAQSIEVVPPKDATIDTNMVPQSSDTKGLSTLFAPRAPHSIFDRKPGQGNIALPPPQSVARQADAREQEMMDRRRNWVFMTPDEMMGTDVQVDPGKEDGQNLTVMERYYQRLYDADHPSATNNVSKMDVPSWNRSTNAFSVDGGNSSSSYYSGMDPGSAFQPTKPNVFTPVFGSTDSSSGVGMPTPEEVRMQEQQRAHMESFKQLWDIDQSKPAVASTPAPVQSSSSSGFGLPQMEASMFRPPAPASSSSGGNNVQNTELPKTLSQSRAAARPPRADFNSPPSRPF